ncbi:MAG: hypothetical protein U9Q04_00465 [Campylobacterota bacterium]|nr:hypothetical protein [Campylobacterota bacterium]
MNEKRLYQVIKEHQVIAVLLAHSQEECEKYLLEYDVVDSIEYVSIVEVASKKQKDDDGVIPLMVAHKSSWYDLKHYKHLYIYEA